MEMMKRKQKLHAGNRSDTILQELDALVAKGLSYTDMTEDIKEALSQSEKTQTRAHTI
jgi:hypothetical protein